MDFVGRFGEDMEERWGLAAGSVSTKEMRSPKTGKKCPWEPFERSLTLKQLSGGLRKWTRTRGR